MRKIPATMATQHPDNSCKTYFTDKRFISATDEVEECYRCFSELGVDEYMWDWEGKFVDEAVIDRLFNSYHDYFKENQIGRDIFLTFRIPNIWIESSHKLPRAFMNLLSSEKAANDYKLHPTPLFEIILPMTTSADQLIYLQKAFKKIAQATADIFQLKSKLDMVELIPLLEEFQVMANCKNILHEYVKSLKEEYDHKPSYIRIFTARSDPAINGGFIPAKLSAKLAINLYHEFEDETGIEVHPWIGGGSLPFRGGINPENIEAAIEEYKGVSTLTAQSAFRYDYDLDEVKAAIKKMNSKLPNNRKKYIRLSKDEQEAIKELNTQSIAIYQPIIEKIADTINTVSVKLPSHRERVQHIGLFGYSRGVGKVKLPRAIKFTGALYSLGLPPELIASGRVLKLAKEMKILDLVEKLCPYLREDFAHAGHYLNKENLEHMCKNNGVWKEIRDEIDYIEDYLGIDIGPKEPHHIIHRNFTSNIFHRLNLDEDFSRDVLKAAEIRKSLG